MRGYYQKDRKAEEMKKIFIGLFVFTILFAQVRWDQGDTYKEVTFQTLGLIDLLQTIKAVRKGHVEMNPILGIHPSNAELIFYSSMLGYGHYIVSKLLPNNGWRDAWQYITIGIEFHAVQRNFYIMFKYNI